MTIAHKRQIAPTPPQTPPADNPAACKAYTWGYKMGQVAGDAHVAGFGFTVEHPAPYTVEKALAAWRKTLDEPPDAPNRRAALAAVQETVNNLPPATANLSRGVAGWFGRGFTRGAHDRSAGADPDRGVIHYSGRDIPLGKTTSFTFMKTLIDRVGKPINHRELAAAVPCRQCDVVDKARRLREALRQAGHPDVAQAIKAARGTYMLPLYL